MSIQDLLAIAQCAHRFDATCRRRLLLGGQQIGWLAPELAARLASIHGVFEARAGDIVLAPGLDTPNKRTSALAIVVGTLMAEGHIAGVRNELYAARQRFDDPALFEIERAAARPFGLTTWAAHVNGVTDGGHAMWIARRSAEKPVDPGMLDNLVGGGIASGHGVAETVVKECWEEAGIPASLARQARPAGTVQLLREVREGVQSEVIFVHDLHLPPDFEPRNTDGEVEGFERVPVAKLPDRLAECEFTCDSALVILDFLVRHGYLHRDLVGYDGLVAAMSGRRGENDDDVPPYPRATAGDRG